MRVDWPTEDIVGSWTLVDDDWRLVGNKTGSTRLGFALLLKFFDLEARFPSSAAELPPEAVAYVAKQVAVDVDGLVGYDWSARAIKRHRVQIRSAFGFREFTRGDEDKLAAWLAEEVCPVELRDEQLRDALLVRCRTERIEPPGRPERIIGAARAAFDRAFCEWITVRLPDDCVARLEELAAGGEDHGRRGLLAELKADPGQVSLETLLREVDKLAGSPRWGCRRTCLRTALSGWCRPGGLARAGRTRRTWRR